VGERAGTIVNLDWYRSLRGNAVHAFWASAGGWALDAFDFLILTFALTAITATFGISSSEAGLIATVTLGVSALGGILAGALADRIGRVRTLILTIACYALFTFLSGLAQSYEQLLVFRALQGLGFGGEWAAGAILMAEISNPEQRGRALGAIQSSWAIGWGLAAVTYTVVFSVVSDDETAWRVLFWLGVLPGLLILYVRRKVQEPDVYVETRRAREERGSMLDPLVQLFRSDLRWITVPATLLAIGAQGGYYAIFTWLPTFLEEERGLTIVGSAGYYVFVIGGAFLGYVTSGYLHDLAGRRPTFALFAVCSGATLFSYTQLPEGQNTVLLFLGLPLGFFTSGLFSGFGSFLAELFPSRARGAGQGFAYNFGRAAGAFFPTAVGFMSTSAGLSNAIAFGVIAYALCLVALLFLPETRAKRLVPVD
jgi:MFS family permease